MKPLLTVIIPVGNEEAMIADCLKSCLFADKIILVRTYSATDETIRIAKGVAKKIIVHNALKNIVDFSYWRNEGAKLVKSGWLLYIDADERITPQLQSEIVSVISQKNNLFTNYDIPRANYFLGHRVRYGGTYPDYVKRLFLKSKFTGWVNSLHEQPQVSGPSSTLNSDLIHLTHRSLNTMLTKSLQWTPLEAKMLYDTNHPPVVWWRIIRMMLTKLWERLILQSMWRDGTVGWISALFETFDTFMIYSQLWELQQHD